MRALIQRVSKSEVIVEESGHNAKTGKGMVILLGVKEDDTGEDVKYLAGKCANMRIFEDENEKMNFSVKEIAGEVLIISQFTLYGETKKGNRPNFMAAAGKVKATYLYEQFIKEMGDILGEEKIKTGEFGAMMEVRIFNDGPVTILAESEKR